MSPRNLFVGPALSSDAATTTSRPLPEQTPSVDKIRYWADFSSNWTYPTPLNKTFLANYYLSPPQYVRTNNTQDIGHVTDLIFEALQNVTMPKEGEFGSESFEYRVGDVLVPAWTGEDTPEDRENAARGRSVSLNCVVCSRGREEGSIFTACGNYTDESHISYFYNTTAHILSGTPLTLPELSSTISLPDHSCGLCFLSLSTINSYAGLDQTVPFAVSQSGRDDSNAPHWRFDSAHPSGIADPSITKAPKPTETHNVKGHVEYLKPDGPNVGMIVGVVIGVLGGTAIIGVLSWFFWRKGKTKEGQGGKGVESPPNDSEDEEPGGLQLQPVIRGGVERRRSRDEDGEVPPTYHEAVATGDDGKATTERFA